jgi:hypothetical protein
MTIQGFLFLAFGWGIVLALAIFSITRLLKRNKD